MKGSRFGLDVVFSESVCQTVLPHLILSDAHLTSVGYSFPTAVANLCVTKDIFAGKYFSYNYIELRKTAGLFSFFALHVNFAKKRSKLCFTFFFLILGSVFRSAEALLAKLGEYSFHYYTFILIK